MLGHFISPFLVLVVQKLGSACVDLLVKRRERCKAGGGWGARQTGRGQSFDSTTARPQGRGTARAKLSGVLTMRAFLSLRRGRSRVFEESRLRRGGGVFDEEAFRQEVLLVFEIEPWQRFQPPTLSVVCGFRDKRATTV